MSQKNRTLLISLAIGMILGCFMSTAIGSIVWFNSNPSISEVRNAISENLTLTEQELNEVTQMAIVGAVIDFILHLMLLCEFISFSLTEIYDEKGFPSLNSEGQINMASYCVRNGQHGYSPLYKLETAVSV